MAHNRWNEWSLSLEYTGKVIGPSFSTAQIPDVISRLVATYMRYRESDEPFIDTVQRIGLEPFKERVYGSVVHGLVCSGG